MSESPGLSENEDKSFFSNVPSREVWEMNMSENEHLYGDIDREITRIYGEDIDVDCWGEMCKEYFAEALKAGLPREDLRHFGAYHIMIGSSTSYERRKLFDLPEDLSIIGFMKKKLAELKEQKSFGDKSAQS